MSNINQFLCDDLKGGKNIKYNNFGISMFGDNATLLGAGRASFSAGAVVDGYKAEAVFTDGVINKISDVKDNALKARLSEVEDISEILRSLVISFNADKRFVITVHFTALGTGLMKALTGREYVIDTEYYAFGKFALCIDNVDKEYYDCGVELDDGRKLECVLNANNGLVTVRNMIFKNIPAVIIDETRNATGGFDVKPENIHFNGEVLKDVKYGDRVMAKSIPGDINYETDKNESEEARTMRETLDLYVPENVDTTRENALILCIHGGAWTGGDKSAYADACKYYASLGYFSATINHTYAVRTYEDNGERVTFGCILQEIDSAFAKIKALSDERGWNIAKAATTGYSSGSHLATLYAYSMGHRENAPIPVVFTFSMVGPMSFHMDFWHCRTMPIGPQIVSFYIDDPKLFSVPESGSAKERFDAVAEGKAERDTLDEYDYTKYDKATFDEKIGSISPLWFVKKGQAVPTILAEASMDNFLISDKHGTEMEKALTAAGIEHKVIIFPNSDHAGAGNAECGNVYRKYQKIFMKRYFGY